MKHAYKINEFFDALGVLLGIVPERVPVRVKQKDKKR